MSAKDKRGKTKKRKHLTANAILIRDGKALLVQRSSTKRYYAGFWDIPGGHIKKKEMPEEALVRETAEEIGVNVTDFYLFAQYEENDPTSGDLSHHYVYVVTGWAGEPENLAPDEHVALGWFSIEDLDGLLITPSTRAELVSLLPPPPDPACKLCRIEKGLIYQTAYWQVVLNRNQNYLGKTFLVLNRHLTDHWQMNDPEWFELRSLGAKLKAILTELFQPDHFNYAFLQNQDAHVHLHIIPRYAAPRAFGGETFSDGRLGEHYALDIKPTNDEVFEQLRLALAEVFKRNGAAQ
jgi:mutator protein MutT